MRRSTVQLAAAAVSAAVLAGCPALGDPNPASHAIWWVGGAMFLLLLVFLAVEIADWCRAAWRRLRGTAPPPGPFPPGDEAHRIREERRPLRRRYLWRPRLVRRTWDEGKNERRPL